MAINPEEQNIVSLLVGGKVIVEYMRGPELTQENLDSVLDEGEILTGQPTAKTAFLHLEGYSSLGIEVSRTPGTSPTRFIPWGAVLSITAGVPRQDLVKMEKEATSADEPESTEQDIP